MYESSEFLFLPQKSTDKCERRNPLLVEYCRFINLVNES